ncbi:MAG: hypothetical protein IJZ88_04730 [Clostridia bacterium]|nr:hypothetical protein [Clostridia bacterium]
MKKNFSTVKNFILLIASALTLVAVTFAWYAVTNQGSLSMFTGKVNGSTLSVTYNESTDGGVTYQALEGDLEMENMVEGQKKMYRIDVKTFPDVPIKLAMSFEGLVSTNDLLPYVYFDYKIVCNTTGVELESQTGLKMAEYTVSNVFAYDISDSQAEGNNDYSVYYNVYVVTGDEVVEGAAELGEVKLQGQQVG